MTSSGLSVLPVLASLSAAAPVDAAEDDCATIASTAPFFIKNTFVQVFDNYLASIAIQQKRRSSSAPPMSSTPCAAFRPKACALDNFVRETSANSIHESTKCIPCSQTSPYSSSLASTAAKDDSELETASFAESFEDDSVDVNTLPAATSRPEAEAPPACRDAFNLQLSELLPPRAALSSNAKAFTSTGLGSLPTHVRLGFAEVVAAGHSSLMAAPGITSVRASENSDGLSLIASVQSPQCGSAKAAALAGEAMLAAAVQSESVYVVGYKQDPFKPLRKGFGFRTQLAMVQDEALACWDLLAKGVCFRGCSCKWQHPAFQTTVSVSFEVIPPLPLGVVLTQK